MKDFAEVIGEPYLGHQKSKREIRDTTRGKPEKPPNYEYGKKLPEWDASLPVGTDVLLAAWQPLFDRIIVRLLPKDVKPNAILLTDPQPLIGGQCRKAIVLKLGTGKRWRGNDRIPFSVKPGDEVLIGNWVDLEIEDIALCLEGDIRAIVWHN